MNTTSSSSLFVSYQVLPRVFSRAIMATDKALGIERSQSVLKIGEHRSLRTWLETMKEDMSNVSLSNMLCLQSILTKGGWIRNQDESWSKKTAKLRAGELYRFDQDPDYQNVRTFHALTLESILQEEQELVSHFKRVIHSRD